MGAKIRKMNACRDSETLQLLVYFGYEGHKSRISLIENVVDSAHSRAVYALIISHPFITFIA